MKNTNHERAWTTEPSTQLFLRVNKKCMCRIFFFMRVEIIFVYKKSEGLQNITCECESCLSIRFQPFFRFLYAQDFFWKQFFFAWKILDALPTFAGEQKWKNETQKTFFETATVGNRRKIFHACLDYFCLQKKRRFTNILLDK